MSKNRIQKEILEEAKAVDPFTAKMMRGVSTSLSKCSSRTLFDVVSENHHKLCRQDIANGKNPSERKKPNVDQYVELKGNGDDNKGDLGSFGLLKCKRIQCPLCCFARSYIRRNNALDWAKEKDWSGYYCVSLTFTVSHKLKDSESVDRFKKILDILTMSLKGFANWTRRISSVKNKGYFSNSPEDIGFISSLECTFGKNGLHPHFHTIFFTKCEKDVEKLREWFRRDRVKVWKRSGGNLLRMPDINEDKSFQILVRPNDKVGPEKIISYINKGLFETISVADKDKNWSKTSKNIFNLSGSDLKYFCVFFEATRGKRFYRSGGVCKQIKTISESLEEWESGNSKEAINKNMKKIWKISTKEDGIDPSYIKSFVELKLKDLETKANTLSPKEIDVLFKQEWNKFYTAMQQFRMEIAT